MATFSTFALVLVIFLVWYAESMLAEARRGGGGGSRGGFSRGGSRGSRSTRGGYSSSRTSTNPRGYGFRSGTRARSSYISYIPTSRYRRMYTVSYSSFYFYYYNMYFYHSGSYYYIHRRRPGPEAYVCANYEANVNGTVMGVFTCPNSWEPLNFTYCCGQDYAEFCCDKRADGSIEPWLAGVIAVVVIAAVATIIGLCACWCCGCPCKKKTSEYNNTTVISTVQASQPYLEYQPQPIPKAADPFQAPTYIDEPPSYTTTNDLPYPVASDPDSGYTVPPPYPMAPNGQPQPNGIDNPSYEKKPIQTMI